MFDRCTQTKKEKRNLEQQAPLKLKRKYDLLHEAKQYVEKKKNIELKVPKTEKYQTKSKNQGNQTKII